MSLLQISGLEVTYPGSPPVRAVRGATVRVQAGEITGLAGESGCGKTTIAYAVLRLLPPGTEVRGEILLDGEDVLAMHWGRLRAVRWAGASIVFQGARHSLNPLHRVRTQLAEPVRLHDGISRSDAAERAAQLLDRVGLAAGLGDRYPHELSGGQQQRVMIAMALACSPRLVIADEPTSAVDAVTRRHLLEVLGDVVRGGRAGVLMIGHDMAALASSCDRLAIMYAGRVVEEGSTAALLAAPRHPYSRALFAATGTTGDPGGRRRPRPLPGDPPDPARPLPGCAFRPRCASAAPECAHGPVPLRPDGDRRVACLHPVPAPTGTVPETPAAPAAAATAQTPDATPVLEVRDLTVRLGGRRGVPAVDGATLQVGAGEIVALVGESGAGKSTLARSIVGLCRPQAGQVTVGGRPVPRRARDLRELRREVQYVPQDPGGALHPAHTVERAVLEGLRIRGHRRHDALPRALSAIARMGLRPPERFLPLLPGELSGGQQARVALAAAVAVRPRILIADEPAAALDATVRAEILALLLDLRRTTGMSVLLVTHDLVAAWQVADRIAVMRHGRVVETGPVEQLYAEPAHPWTRVLLSGLPSRSAAG
ncbi:ABC transporter ATP-binding protein [Actinoplanes sp. NPDC051861]|uniref:ABC transporter ATP-binding protein n=1 Tax=Actinoplanes sp. NPDC051861 TaxID=3155170 RepID=UPI0034449B3D